MAVPTGVDLNELYKQANTYDRSAVDQVLASYGTSYDEINKAYQAQQAPPPPPASTIPAGVNINELYQQANTYDRPAVDQVLASYGTSYGDVEQAYLSANQPAWQPIADAYAGSSPAVMQQPSGAQQTVTGGVPAGVDINELYRQSNTYDRSAVDQVLGSYGTSYDAVQQAYNAANPQQGGLLQTQTQTTAQTPAVNDRIAAAYNAAVASNPLLKSSAMESWLASGAAVNDPRAAALAESYYAAAAKTPNTGSNQQVLNAITQGGVRWVDAYGKEVVTPLDYAGQGESGAGTPSNYMMSPDYWKWMASKPADNVRPGDTEGNQAYAKALTEWQKQNPSYVNPEKYGTFEEYLSAVTNATQSDNFAAQRDPYRFQSFMQSYYGPVAIANPLAGRATLPTEAELAAMPQATADYLRKAAQQLQSAAAFEKAGLAPGNTYSQEAARLGLSVPDYQGFVPKPTNTSWGVPQGYSGGSAGTAYSPQTGSTFNNGGSVPGSTVSAPPGGLLSGTTTQMSASNMQPSSLSITPQETTAWQLNQLLNEGSPLMESARGYAMEQANSRGLLNSNLAVQSGQRAVIDAALPIAQQDAQTYATAGRAKDAFGYSYALNDQNIAGDMALNAQQAKNAQSLQAQQDAATLQRQVLSGQQSQELAKLNNAAQLDATKYLNTTLSAEKQASLSSSDRNNMVSAIQPIFQSAQSLVSQIMTVPDSQMDQTSKTNAINNILDTAYANADAITQVYGYKVSW